LHLSAYSREYKLVGRGKDPKSLGLIEASANIIMKVKTMKCSPALSEALDVSIYSLKEDLQEHWGLSHMGEEVWSSPVAGMALVLTVDLYREGMSGSCICIFDYGESRGQGRGLGHVPEPV
jgi:hypothetical protein